jgi:hypothetical protein
MPNESKTLNNWADGRPVFSFGLLTISQLALGRVAVFDWQLSMIPQTLQGYKGDSAACNNQAAACSCD